MQITHIPYRGSSPAMVDLMGGQVQIAFETASSVIPHIKSGKVRALAVLSAARNPQLPDVPTMAEAGVPGVEMSAWYGIYMPSGTPAAIQRRVHDEVNAILALSDTRARLQAIGADVSPMSQEQFARFHQAENQRYAAIIKKNHISVSEDHHASAASNRRPAGAGPARRRPDAGRPGRHRPGTDRPPAGAAEAGNWPTSC